MSYESYLQGTLALTPLPADEQARSRVRAALAGIDASGRGGATQLTPMSHGLSFVGAVDWVASVDVLRAVVETLGPLGFVLEGNLVAVGEDEATLARVAVKSGQIQVVEVELDEDEGDVETWAQALAAEDPALRVHAAGQLAAYPCPESVAALASVIDSSVDPRLRRTALESLGELGELSSEVFPQIRELLRDPDPQVRYWATFVLGRMGARALEAREDLKTMASETETGPKYGAIDALKRLQGK